MVDTVPAIDRETLVALLEAVGGDHAILEDLAATFLADVDTQVDELRCGLTTQDAAAVHRAAHSLKSTSASFGATRLTSASKEIEESALSGAIPSESAVDGLASEAAHVKVELPSMIASLGGPN